MYTKLIDESYVIMLLCNLMEEINEWMNEKDKRHMYKDCVQRLLYVNNDVSCMISI